jgi:hypothetical protein
MQKSMLLVGESAKTTHTHTRNYTWGHTWGALMDWVDPDVDGVYQWFRADINHHLYWTYAWTNAPLDSMVSLFVHPPTPFTPTASGATYINLEAKRGATPHLTQSEVDYITGHLSEYQTPYGEGPWLCPIWVGPKVLYFLYHDPGLPGICNPGAVITIMTPPQVDPAELEAILTPEAQDELAEVVYPRVFSPSHIAKWSVYEYAAGSDRDDMTVSGTLASGSLTLSINMPWVPTSEIVETGFYLTTEALAVGGTFYLGPNALGQEGNATITSIIDSGRVGITASPYTFNHNDPLVYKYGSMTKENTIRMPEGTPGKSIGAYTTQSGGKYSDVLVSTKGSMQTSTQIETFIPIPWAIPAPYSIRNVPHTNIWQRISSPGTPLNWDSLIYRVNGIEIPFVIVGGEQYTTGRVNVDLIPEGGADLYYDPTEDFEFNSRVNISIEISASPNIVDTLKQALPAGFEYMKVTGGVSAFQPGGLISIGPNPEGNSEHVTVRAMVSEDEVMITPPTTYEYIAGNTIVYTHDDYPVEIEYWFDIVDDFRPPEIFNIYPYNGMQSVDIRHWIRFEIQDEGLGVDISTLTLTVNNLVVIPQVYKYSDHWYQVVYTPPLPFYYNSTVECFATVADASSSQNRAFAVWNFDTAEAEVPMIANPDPYYCAFPIHLKDDVSVDVYGRAGGANLESLVFSIDQKKYFPVTYPKIYRFQ